MANLDPSVDVIWGVAFDDTLEDKVKITILAAGFDVTIREEEKMEMERGSSSAPNLVFSPRASHRGAPQPQPKVPNKERLRDNYGAKVEDIRNQNVREKYVVLSREQLDDDAVIDQLEKYPALNRDKEIRTAIKNTSSPSKGGISTSLDDNPGDDNLITFS